MRNLVLALLLLAGCSGHSNPDPAAADAERRERALVASVGSRAVVVRRDAARPTVAYDVADLVCPDFFGKVSFRAADDPDDGCFHLSADLVEGMVASQLGVDGESADVGQALDVVVVEGDWPAQEHTAAYLETLRGQRPCSSCPGHGARRGGPNPAGR